jgi:osmotically-inducible protein OsmY
MNISQRWGWGCLLCGLALIIAGCSKGDTERLARVGRKITEKVEANTNDRLNTGWQSFRANMKENGLTARVSTRLRWDSMLADTPIDVEASGGIVTLSGTVANLEQRRRAVALAESTVGVEKVVDLLELPKADE